MSRKQCISYLVKKVVAAVHPLRIVLFGSAARKNVRAVGDLDIMVVMPDGSHRRQIAQRLYQKISGVGMPFDVIVATPEDLLKHKDNKGLIYYTILREGRELYAA
jgi:predicted nucleotidyltransferase